MDMGNFYQLIFHKTILFTLFFAISRLLSYLCTRIPDDGVR